MLICALRVEHRSPTGAPMIGWDRKRTYVKSDYISRIMRLASLAALASCICSSLPGPASAILEDPIVLAASSAAHSCKPIQANPSVQVVEGLALSPAKFQKAGDDVLCMIGHFVYESDASIDHIDNPSSVRFLIVNSGGGLVGPAIHLAQLAERYRWTVVISGHCHSSCANYLFLADVDKIVLPQSFVSWHGLPPDSAEARRAIEAPPIQQFLRSLERAGLTGDEARAYLVQMSVSSERFYADRGLPPDLARRRPTFRNDDASEYADRYRKAVEAGPVTWTYSKKSLSETWNIKNIRSMWEPSDRDMATSTFKKVYGWELFFFD
jgi:hypothetical protein